MFKDSVISLLLLATIMSVFTGLYGLAVLLGLLILRAFFTNHDQNFSVRIQKTLDYLGTRLAQAAISILILLLLVVLLTRLEIQDAILFATMLAIALTPVALLLSLQFHKKTASLKLQEHHNLILIRVVLTQSVSLLVFVVLGGLGLLLYHAPYGLQAIEILLLTTLVVTLPLAAVTYDKARHKIPTETAASIQKRLLGRQALGEYITYASIIATLTYLNYLYFFVRHHLALGYLPVDAPIYQQASTLTLTTAAICYLVHVLFERSDRHDYFLTDHIWHNKRLLYAFVVSFTILLLAIYLPPLQHLFKTASIGIVDWLTAFLAGTLYAATLGAHRHTRKHSRAAVLLLHKEVRKHN